VQDSATPKPCPRSSKHWGIGVRMFAVRQREALGKLDVIKALRSENVRVQQRKRWAQLGDPQAVPALTQALGDSE
jgi:hypothetical protein